MGETETNAFEISWTAVSGADRYELWEWWDFYLGWQRLERNLHGVSYSRLGLTPGRTYYYAVRAVDSNGVGGAWSNQPSATAPEVAIPTPTETPTPTATPTPASRLQAPAITVSEPMTTTIEIVWTEVIGADRYELWEWWDFDPGWQRIGDNLQSVSYSQRGRTPGRTYHYAVRAIDANGVEGAWSDYPSATVPINSQSIAAHERASLTALYDATDGANWINSDNWLTEEPVGTWHGITAGSDGRVTELRLPGNEMNGSIPDLGALANLTTLDLNTNPLTGSIPDLSGLTSLTTLNLGSGLLNGPIPDLSALTALTSLDLRSNDLTGEIPDLSALTNLATLNLSHNQLDGPVPDLSAHTGLTFLDLAGNNLCIPSDTDLSTFNAVAATHMRSLNLPTCTDS